MKIVKIILLSCLLIVMLAGGFYFGYDKGIKNENNQTSNIKKMNSNDANSINNNHESKDNTDEESKIDIRFIIRDKNSDNVHTIIEPVSSKFVNKSEDELKDYIINKHPSWEIIEIDRIQDNQIVVHTWDEGSVDSEYYEEESSKYEIVVQNGGLVIYKLDINGNKTIYDTTGILVDTMKEEDKLMFEKGKIVDTKEELESLLENYSS